MEFPRSSPGGKDLLASSLLGKWAWGAPAGEQGREKGNECVNEISPTAGPPGDSIEHVTRHVSRRHHHPHTPPWGGRARTEVCIQEFPSLLGKSPSYRLQLPNLPKRVLACSQTEPRSSAWQGVSLATVGVSSCPGFVSGHSRLS